MASMMTRAHIDAVPHIEQIVQPASVSAVILEAILRKSTTQQVMHGILIVLCVQKVPSCVTEKK